MSRTFWASALAAAFALGAQTGEPKQTVLEAPGVLSAKADLATKAAEATYDPDRVSVEKLAKAVTAAGYPAAAHKS